jgi:hypothetical protein
LVAAGLESFIMTARCHAFYFRLCLRFSEA